MAVQVRVSCWLDWHEWAEVFQLLYDFQDHRRLLEGLSHVEAWKSRGKLPVAVECTANLVSALTLTNVELEELESVQSNIRLSLGMALVRFVNGMTDQGIFTVAMFFMHHT